MKEKSKKQPRAFWEHPAPYVVTAVLLVVAIILAITFRWINYDQFVAFKLSLVELAVEIAVVGIAGGLIKRAYDEHVALTSFRAEILTALGSVHAKVYVLRRALALQPDDPDVVRERMFELMAIRTELGNFGHRVRTKRDVGQHEVLANIEVIRSYFEELIDEAMSEAQSGKMIVGPKLRLFIATKSDAYRRRFKAPYFKAKRAADPSWEPTKEQLDRNRAPTPEGDNEQEKTT